jgi:Protein of unknown function (DUF3108)
MMPTPLRHAGIAALALWAATVQAAPPERITLTYEMKRNGTVLGDVSETLEHDGHTYAITSEVKGRGFLALVGVLKRTSRGHVTPQGLRPDEFRDERPGGWVASAKFDWDAHSVTQERKGKSETLPIPGNAQDTLSLAYSFAFVPPKDKDKEYDVTRADGRGLTPFRFTVVGSEKLATPAGELQTLRITKVRDGPDDKTTDIWFAAERDFLPVRVLVVDTDGTRADQIVTRIGK